MRGRTVDVKCSCGTMFKARVADVNRGWGKFCSKKCKAVKQEQRTGQYANYIHGRGRIRDDSDYRGSGVDKETYLYYQNEYGGTPQFNRNGVYQGFTMSPEELSHGGYGDADWDTPFHDGKF